MNLIQESYQRLFPDKEFPYQAEMEYNRRLAPFNANIRLYHNTIYVNMNLQWKDIDQEIKMGLIQHLLLKILKQRKVHSPNIDLYNHFIRQIPILTPKTKTDEKLQASFQRVNLNFFQNSIEETNLQWGTNSKRKLASYNFHDDTVTVSTIFKESRDVVLDYLMYHELLHKHHKFEHKNGRSSFHSRAFREDEQRFPQHQEIEREITQIIKGRRTLLSFWK